MTRRVFTYYGAQGSQKREDVVRSCRALLDASGQASQCQFSAIVIDHVLKAFRQEEDDQTLGALASLLYKMTDSLLQFSDFTRAGRIFAEIRDRRRDLIKARRAIGPGFAVLNRAVDAATQALLMAEFQSKNPERQEKAAWYSRVWARQRSRSWLRSSNKRRSCARDNSPRSCCRGWDVTRPSGSNRKWSWK